MMIYSVDDNMVAKPIYTHYQNIDNYRNYKDDNIQKIVDFMETGNLTDSLIVTPTNIKFWGREKNSPLYSEQWVFRLKKRTSLSKILQNQEHSSGLSSS